MTFHAGRGQLWAIVLAGGEGVRLRALTRLLHGEDRPKQYAVLRRDKCLLQETLDRVALLVPRERTVIVTQERHARYMPEELDPARPGPPWVLAQPEDRGTAAGVLLPARWILARDAEAIAAVFPSDHLVVDEAAFMGHVEQVAEFVDGRPDGTVLLGARPTEPETDYGWVEPGEPIGWVEQGPLRRVSRFVEKPDPAEAQALYASGALWNTFVLVARAAVLVAAGRARLPDLDERLRRAVAFAGTEHERWALRQAYGSMAKANFSRSLLERWPAALAVSALPAEVRWCDLGTPERVVRTLTCLGMSAPWMATLR